MKDQDKTKAQLINELQELRQLVTELYEAEDQLRTAKEDLEQQRDFADIILNTAQAIILILDTKGRILTFNPFMEKICGYSLTEVKDMDWFETFLHERDRKQIRDVFLETVHDMETSGTVNPIRTRDGREILVEWFNNTLKDKKGNVIGVLSIGQDITERKKADEELRLNKFSIDHAADAAFWMGKDAHLIYVNQAACRSLGYVCDELLKMTVHDVDPNFPPEVWPEHWRELKERGSFTFESMHRRKDGSVFPVEININYLEYDGREYNFAFARDITDRVRAEKERLLIEVQIQQVQKLESLGILAGGIAHDFNNILMGVLGYAELTLMELGPESPGRRTVEQIVKSALHAADLTKQLLAFSGRGRFVVEPLDLSKLIREMTHLFEATVSKKAILKYNLDDNLPAVEGDATQIRQVVMNLVSNATDAIEDRSGVITITTGAMACDREFLSNAYLRDELEEGTYVYVEVADTGIGMDENTRAKIFDPFFTTKFAGRGLGLAAVLGIVRGHRGTVKVQSEPGRGAKIRVLLPGSDKPASEEVRETERKGDWRGSGTVLVVDDEETVRAVGKLTLERAGFDVITASDGNEAIRLFSKEPDRIVAVLLDMTMPTMSGEETFYELRVIRPDIPIILSSGYNEQEVLENIADRTRVSFIQKPYKPSSLIEKVHDLVEL